MPKPAGNSYVVAIDRANGWYYLNAAFAKTPIHKLTKECFTPSLSRAFVTDKAGAEVIAHLVPAPDTRAVKRSDIKGGN